MIRAISKDELDRRPPSPHFSRYEARAKYDVLKEPEWFAAKIKEVFGHNVAPIAEDFDPLFDVFLSNMPDGTKVTFGVPPFSQAAKYLEIAADESSRNPDHKIMFLISARTEAYSWHEHVFGKAYVLFLRGPFRFIGLDRGVSAALVIYGQLSDLEKARLCTLGSIVEPSGHCC